MATHEVTFIKQTRIVWNYASFKHLYVKCNALSPFSVVFLSNVQASGFFFYFVDLTTFLQIHFALFFSFCALSVCCLDQQLSESANANNK